MNIDIYSDRAKQAVQDALATFTQGNGPTSGDELTFCTGLPTRVGVHGPTFPVPEGGALVVLDCDESGKPIKSQ